PHDGTPRHRRSSRPAAARRQPWRRPRARAPTARPLRRARYRDAQPHRPHRPAGRHRRRVPRMDRDTRTGPSRMTGFAPAAAGPRVRDFERTGRSDLEMFMEYDQKEGRLSLPTTKTSREGRDPRDARVLLSSPPKVGKTTLASQWAPDTTLLLDTHKGTALLDGEHYVQPVAT